VGLNPSAIAVGAGSAWVGSRDDGTVARVDPKTNAIRNVSVGGPEAIVIRDGNVLVANQFGGLTTIDPATMIVSTRAAPRYYSSLTQSGGALWGLGFFGDLDRINHGGDVVKTLSNLGIDFFALAAGQGAVWVLDGAGRSVFRVDTATNRAVRLRLPFEPGGIAVGGGSVWVTNPSANSVVRIDPRSNRIIRSTRVGRDPMGIAAGGGSVWVANYEDGTVSRIDPHTGSVVTTIHVGPYPLALAAGLGDVWVAVRAA
jgi:YVTN family beta-propeller protein